MSRRALTLVLALVMVLSTFSMAFAEVGGTITRTTAPVVADVQGTEFEDAVTRLGILDIIKGYPDGTFKPSNTITRAEFAAVSVRAAGLGGLAGTTQGMSSGFNDVPNHHWASGFVGTAASLGIVNGIGHGLFAPDAQVTNEQAITMVVRALGYEPAAQAKGGYPFGYLIVANETGLIDGLEAPQGVPATRGFVSQITNNALEIPMMIQVGYGTSTKYVVSGEDDTKATHLLDKLGLDSAEGIVEDYDAEDLEVVIDGETYDVEEGFDFYAVHGLNVTAWVSDDVVVAVTVEDEVKFDAVEFKADETELTLVTEDKEYDLAEDRDDEIVTEFVLNDEVKDWEDDDFYADYAKVVFEDNDVRFVEGFNFDGFIVADEIDDEVILDINEDELDVEDYLIVKNGKTITVNDIKSEDIVFFSDEEYREYEGFAVVINETFEGTVTRAYTDSFKLDSEDFELDADALYLDGDVLDYVDMDILAGFEEEEGTVTVYVNLLGEVVLMVGEVGDAVTTVHGGILINDAKTFTNRAGWNVAWDLVNEEGEELELDGKTEETSVVKVADQWAVVEYEIDEDGDLEDVVVLEDFETVTGAKVEIDDRYEEEGYRLNDKAVVFLVDLVDEEVDEVFTWADAEEFFGEMVDYTVYYENGDAIYIVVTDSDAGGDFEAGKGVVVERRTLASSEVELTINIDGDEIEFDFKSSDVVGIAKGDFVEFMIDEETETIDEGTIAVLSPSVTGLVDVVSQRNGEFKIDGNDYILDNNAVVFDTDLEEVRLDEADEKVVKMIFDASSTTFVKYVIVTEITADELTAQVAKDAIALIPETVALTDEQIVVDARAAVDSLTVAQKALLTATELLVLTDAEADIVTLKAEADSAVEVQAVIDEINLLPATITLADESAVVAARASFDALTVDQQADVTNLVVLTDAEAAITVLKGEATSVAEVQAVIDEIALLPATITLADEADVIAARASFDALTVDQQADVTNLTVLTDAETVIVDLKAEAVSVAEVQAVIDEIALLPATITLADEADVIAARTSFDALTVDQQADVTNLTVLTDAEATIVVLKAEAVSAAEVQAVIDEIDMLPATIILADESAVLAARVSFDALTVDQQADVTNLTVLTDAEAEILVLKAEVQAVIDEIALLPVTITLADELAVLSARASFDALTVGQQADVTNLTVLTDAEAVITVLKAEVQAVIDEIAALPLVITLVEEVDVIAARVSFDALTIDQQADVTNLTVLTDAEAEIVSLKAAAQLVEDEITVLPEAIDFDDTDPVQVTAVQDAQVSFNALTLEQQALVTNSAKLAELVALLP